MTSKEKEVNFTLQEMQDNFEALRERLELAVEQVEAVAAGFRLSHEGLTERTSENLANIMYEVGRAYTALEDRAGPVNSAINEVLDVQEAVIKQQHEQIQSLLAELESADPSMRFWMFRRR